MKIHSNNGSKINPATEDRQTAILTALQLLLSDAKVARKPEQLKCEFIRPANVTGYNIGDAINAHVANIKEKETMTLSGSIAVKQKETMTLSGSVAVKKKETVTISGTEGSLNIGIAEVAEATVPFTLDAEITAAKYVNDHAALFLPKVVVTSLGADVIFESAVAGDDFADVVAENVAGDLAGAVVHTTANLEVGTGIIEGPAGLEIEASFDTDGATTAAAVKAANEAAYLALGIVLTNDGDALVWEAQTAGVPFPAPVLTNLTGDLAGAVVHTNANVEQGTGIVEGPGALEIEISFDTDGATTAAAVKAANEAAYLALGIVLTNDGDALVWEAQTAGVPFPAPIFTNLTGDLAGAVVHTTANLTLVPFVIGNMAIAPGGGGIINDIVIETNAVQFAEKTVRLWLFNDVPSNIAGDHSAFVNYNADKLKRTGMAYIDVVFDARLGESDTVIGHVTLSPARQYACKEGSSNIYFLLQTLSAVAAPASGGVFNLFFSVTRTA